MSFVENAILSIQRGCERGNDIQDVLLQSELLVRDVVFVRELFPDDDTHENALEAVMDVAITCQALADENHRQHMKGRPLICKQKPRLLSAVSMVHMHFWRTAVARDDADRPTVTYGTPLMDIDDR